MLGELGTGPRRYNELRRGIGDSVADKTLIRTLRDMERSGLVAREVRTTHSPPAVFYRLTAAGRSLLPPLEALEHWWQQYGEGDRRGL